MASSQNKQIEINSSQIQRHPERKNSFHGSRSKYDCSQAESATAEWSASSIKQEKLEATKKKLSHVPLEFGHSIVKVPRNLHQLEPNAFVPEVVSIGPYHWGKEHLQQMEKHKWRLLKRVIQRTECSLETCLSVMLETEMAGREWYNFNDRRPKDSYDFAEMMLLDSCFILEAFYAHSCGHRERDPLFAWRDIIIRDLLMLENQLPFTVLAAFAKIWNNFPFQDPKATVRRLALEFFRSVMPGLSATYDDPLHLLDLVRGSIPAPYPNISSHGDEGSVFAVSGPTTPGDSSSLLDIEMGNSNNDNDEWAHDEEGLPAPGLLNHLATRYSQTNMVTDSVTKLRAAGVYFVKLDSRKMRFMEIEFKDGNLYIPPLTIHKSTKPIFLNLMAFEQCYIYRGRHITSYMTFMDSLINSHKDVEYLQAMGIICHDLGSEQEVADLFNSIRREIFFDPSDYYLHQVTDELNKYTDKKWRKWFATLRQDYLRNPWKILSVVAAGMFLLFTVTQATYAALSYHIHHS